MAKDSEVKLDKQKETKNKVTPLKIDLDLGIDKIVTDLKTVQREAKKATQAIKEMEFAQSQLNQEDEISTLLNLAGRYNFILTATNDSSRGIGKTVAMINKAKKENLLILVPFENGFQQICKQYNFNNFIVLSKIQDMHGVQYHNFDGFLSEDLVSNEEIERFIEISGLDYKGGFNSIHTTKVKKRTYVIQDCDYQWFEDILVTQDKKIAEQVLSQYAGRKYVYGSIWENNQQVKSNLKTFN